MFHIPRVCLIMSFMCRSGFKGSQFDSTTVHVKNGVGLVKFTYFSSNSICYCILYVLFASVLVRLSNDHTNEETYYNPSL